MINAKVTYCLFRENAGVSYEGGGFVRYEEDEKKGILSGRLAGVTLRRLRSVGSDLSIFQQVRVTGSFSASRNPRRVTRMMNDVERAVGPAPRRPPERTGPDY